MIGKRISHYRILEKLGEGGMGEVCLAKDTKLNRRVALKFLPVKLSSDEELRARFKREAQAAATLNHPNIITVYEVAEHENRPFIAMEYVEGESLKDLIAKEELSIGEVLAVALQISDGLAAAHQAGIVHRDIKPQNILMGKDGRVRICDFGLAKAKRDVTLTQAGSTLGTVAYMSPEQAQGKEADHRSDIFSLGVVLYEMITGQLPFKGDHEAAVVNSIVNDTPEPLARYKSDVPGELQRIVGKEMEKNREMRYQHADDLGADLRKVKTELATGVTKAPDSAKKLSPSVAVLPFTNLSADKEQDYFCDGMAEEIINALTHVESLRVVARTSAFVFRDRREDIREIGRKLKVDKVLDGSVRKAGNRLRITAQLINVSDGYHLWSERYDREMEDVFVIQDEITLAIVDKLKIKLLGKEKQELVKRHTDNQEAYSFYLKGRYFWNKMNPGAYEKAIENFEQAIEKDPNNAVAFAGLADSYWWSSFWGNLPPRQTFPKAREAAEKAIAIDDTLGEAHASLASIHTIYDWDWEAAEREFKRALELAPGSSYIYVYYSIFLNLRRRHDEAIIQARKAQELDPVSGLCNTNLGHRLWQARRYDEAIEEFQKWLVIEPNDWFAHHHLCQLYLEKSMIKKAIEEIDTSLKLSGGVPMNVANAAMTHYRFGDREVAERLFDSLKKRASHEYIQPMGFVFIYLARGEADQAFEWVKKACEERDSFLPWFRVTPVDCMHFPSDPRINELLDRLGLP
jgi:TolB-like protein/Tfp pilus assembly protein PilF/predicted Ser/Thr protein kinase